MGLLSLPSFLFSLNVPAMTQEVKKNAYPSYFKHAPLDHAVAGITAGWVACLLLHPFDMVKIRLQVEPKSIYRNSFHAIRTIVRTEGLGAFKAGLTASMTGNASAWGLYFMGYNHMKEEMRAWSGQQVLTSTQSGAASMSTGLGVLCLTNPIWVAKTRLCTQHLTSIGATSSSSSSATAAAAASSSVRSSSLRNEQFRYRGLAHCLRTIAAEEGLRGLYAGFSVGSIGIVHGALQFSFYDAMKGLVLRHKAAQGGMDLAHELESEKPHKFSLQGDAASFSTLEYLSIAVASKTFATTLTYPLQLMRSNLQVIGKQAGAEDAPRRSVLSVAKHIYASRGGIPGFFRGLPLHIVRLTPHTIALFSTYEAVRSFLSSSSS